MESLSSSDQEALSVATRLASKRVITVLLALVVLVPTSLSYAQNEETKEKKVEKFIELAEKARDKTETLINITCANQTALDAIADAELDDELEANVTRFNKAVQNITNAEERLALGDLDGAVANATYALEALRDVFKSIHVILCNAEVSKGQLIDAQGLLQAMKRALERIDKLEEIEDLPVETEWLLGNATLYLNITTAIEWLQLGLVNQTAHNLTMANKLIADAHKALKDAAKEMKTKRIRHYFEVMNKTCERLRRQINKLDDPGGLLARLNQAEEDIKQAREEFENEGSIGSGQLEGLRGTLGDIEDDLKAQRKAEKGNGNGKDKDKDKDKNKD